MSNLTAFPFIGERSEATPGLWNNPFSIISANIEAINSDLTINFASGNTLSIFSSIDASQNLHAGNRIGIGATPSADTVQVLTLGADSSLSDYILFHDTSAAKSNYILGSRVGGTADGLNIFDLSGSTMIVGFSKQSVRYYAPVIGTLFDTGGVVTNVKAFGAVGDGIADDTTLIQNALNATVGGGTVLFPSGTYRVTSTLSAGARQILVGQGWGSILSSQFSGPLLKINGNTTDAGVGQAVMSGLADGFALENIVLFSNSTQSSIGLSLVSYSPSPTKTVRIGGVRNVRIQGFDIGTDLVFIQGFAFYLTQFLGNRVGLYAHDNSQLGLLGQCDFRANTGPATWLSATSEVFGINDTNDSLYGWVFDRCHWEINDSYGILLDGGTYNTFVGCKLEQNNGSFSHFTDRRSAIRPDGNSFIGCTWNGDPDTPTVLQVDMPVGVANLFLNNNFNTTNNSGLSFGAATAHNMIFGGSIAPTQITDRSTGSSNVYFSPSGGMIRRLIGSTASMEWLAPSYFTSGTNLLPGISFLSELSLGWYNSGASTIASSYGTVDFSRSTIQGPLVVNADIRIPDTNRLRLDGTGAIGFQRNATAATGVDVVGSSGATGLILRPNLNLIHFGRSSSSAYFGSQDVRRLEASTQLAGTGATALLPAFAYVSEMSLGWYRSAASTMALSYGTLLVNGPMWSSGISVGGGTLIPQISSMSSLVGAFVVQGSSSSFTGIAWPAAGIGDIVLCAPFQSGAASSVSSGLVPHSLVTVAGQIEFRLSNVSTLVQNQSAQTWVFTRIRPF